MDEARHSKPVLGDNPGGWGGEGGWERVSGSGGHMVTHGWFMLRYGKDHHNMIK